MKKKFKVAAAQIPVLSDIRINLSRIESAVRLAARKKASVVVLPECALSGYPSAVGHKPPSAVDRGELADALAHVRALARECRIHVIVGAMRFSREKVFNSAYAISPSGLILAVYDKVQLMRGKRSDTAYFAAGKSFPVFKVNGIKCALQICFDIRFPENYRHLAAKGVRVVFQLFFGSGKGCAWKLPVLEGALRSRAAENGIFIVASNVAARPQMVLSRVCDPDGVSLAHACYGRRQVISADLDMCKKGGGFLKLQRKDLLKVVARKKAEG